MKEHSVTPTVAGMVVDLPRSTSGMTTSRAFTSTSAKAQARELRTLAAAEGAERTDAAAARASQPQSAVQCRGNGEPSSWTGSPSVRAQAAELQGLTYQGSSKQSRGTAVQADRGAIGGAETVKRAAQAGLGGSAVALPHRERLESAFGRETVEGIQAHVGGPAADACATMGASAYASGEAVAFKDAPDLYTAAHEVAHVVQQRRGVSLPQGVGRAGDVYERDADRVATKVVAGELGSHKSSEVEAAQPAPASAETARTPVATDAVQGQVVQRKVKVGGINEPDANDLWRRVRTDRRFDDLTPQGLSACKKILKDWVKKPAKALPGGRSESRDYRDYAEVATAVLGEYASRANLAEETRLAELVYGSDLINQRLGTLIQALQAMHQGANERWKQEFKGVRERYSYHYSSLLEFVFGRATTLSAAVRSPPTDLKGRIAFIADYAYNAKHIFDNANDFPEWVTKMTAEQAAARRTHWNPDESAPWTREAREHNVPLSAGPSATSANTFTFAEMFLRATADQMEALAWAIFAFYNQSMLLSQSGTHRYHEVFTVAAEYGVPYTKWEYGDLPA